MKATVIATLVSIQLFSVSAFGQVELKREDAFNAPARHAWNLFQIVNHPAVDPKGGRGVPDLTKKIGAPNTTAVWETWRLARSEVFLAGGVKPPEWDDLSLPGGPTSGKVPEPPKNVLIAKLAERQKAAATAIKKGLKPKPLFDPEDGVFSGAGGFGESRMNKATYEFIRSAGLYSVEGQERYAVAFVAGTKPALSFPIDSMEVKAAWVEFTPQEVQAGKDRRFYVAEFNGKKYGLAALHILTKDTPNWFWTTFHHKEAPIPDPAFGHGAGNGDPIGQPAALKGTVWENYQLGGTQTDFVDSIGNPTMLSDALIEKGFVRSSCVSCHARSTVSGVPSFQPLSSAVVLGAPKPADYLKNGKQVLLQTDFLFSLSRAQSEKP